MFLIDSLFDEHDFCKVWDIGMQLSMNHSPFHISSHSWSIYFRLSFKNVYIRKQPLEKERHWLPMEQIHLLSRSNKYRDILLSSLDKVCLHWRTLKKMSFSRGKDRQVCCSVLSRSVMSNSLWPHGL